MKNNINKVIRRLVDLSFKDGKIIEFQVTKSIKVLKSLPSNKAIDALAKYLRELKFNQRQHTLYLETVIPVSSTQINKIKKLVEKKNLPAGRQARITKVVTQINPEILGGFKLKVGDEVWDESIFGKIIQVKETIING